MSEQEINSKKNNLIVFINKRKKILTYVIIIIVSLIISFFTYQYFKQQEHIKTSEQFNTAKIKISKNLEQSKDILINIIEKKNKFYSPMSLNLLLEKKINLPNKKILELFDKVINIRGLEKNTKNLYILKKGLFLSEFSDENTILKTLNPLINSNSIWRTQAIIILEKYYFANNEFEKSKQYNRMLKK